MVRSRIGTFKFIADFDWDWPKGIDRPLIERALALDFVRDVRNLVLIGSNGVGKTMIALNVADAAIHAGHSIIFRTAAELIGDLSCDSPERRRESEEHDRRRSRKSSTISMRPGAFAAYCALPPSRADRCLAKHEACPSTCFKRHSS